MLPADHAEIFKANLQNHDKPLSSWQTYTLKSGDKLDKVAAAHGITLARLKQVNGIGPRTKVAPGMQLLVPVKGTSAAHEPLPAIFTPPATPEPRTRKVVYTVKKGDTLPGIAQRYKVSVDDLRRWNQIGRLSAGQTIVIQQQVSTRARAPAKSKPAKKATQPKPAKAAQKPVPR